VVRQGPGKNVSQAVDGKAIEGNVVPRPAAGVREVQVKAVLA
jgi:hypothetical protein